MYYLNICNRHLYILDGLLFQPLTSNFFTGSHRTLAQCAKPFHRVTNQRFEIATRNVMQQCDPFGFHAEFRQKPLYHTNPDFCAVVALG